MSRTSKITGALRNKLMIIEGDKLMVKIKGIGKLVNKVLSYGGLEISRKKQKKSVWDKTSTLPKVPTLIDVGIGEGGSHLLYKHFPDARMVFIDPMEECRQAVKEYLEIKDNVYIATALGSAKTSTVINVLRSQSMSSLLNRPKIYSCDEETVENREVPVQRLDDVIDQLSLDTPYGIKIDTEGYELEVLKGAPKTLQNTLFVIVEFHFWVNYVTKNPYSLQDLINYMVNAGFSAHFMLPDGMNIVFIATQALDREVI